MKRREPVSKIMSKEVVTLNLTDSLESAEQIFKKENIRHIPVVNNKEVIGILSLTDLMRVSFVDAYDMSEESVDTTVYNMLSLEQVMVRNPKIVDVDLTIKEVTEILSQKEFHALPVTKEGELAGIVTTTDLLKYLLEQY